MTAPRSTAPARGVRVQIYFPAAFLAWLDAVRARVGGSMSRAEFIRDCVQARAVELRAFYDEVVRRGPAATRRRLHDAEPPLRDKPAPKRRRRRD